LRVCKAKPDKEVGIWSDEIHPISFGNSKFSYFKIKIDREQKDLASISPTSPFDFPEETDLKKMHERLYFAGGED